MNYEEEEEESKSDDTATLKLLIHRLVLPYSMNEDPSKNDPETILLEERKELSFDARRGSEKLSKLANLSFHEFIVQRKQIILLFQSEQPDINTEAILVIIDSSSWQLAGVVDLPQSREEFKLKFSNDYRVNWRESEK